VKILYFDVETTGIDPKLNDIVQLSGIIEIDGVEKERFNLNAQPKNYDSINPEALEVTGLTLEQIKSYPPPVATLKRFCEILGRYVDKYNKNDKFYPAGYNVRFDLDFLQQFFLKNGEKYGSGTWQNWQAIDGLPICHFLAYKGILKLENYKLSTVCKHFDIEIQAHDALSDIEATRNLLKKFDSIINIL
jgi:DNA polymerase-3 subunit epsilon